MTAARQQADAARGAAHAADGTMGDRSCRAAAERAAALAEPCAQSRRGRAGGDGPQGRSAVARLEIEALARPTGSRARRSSSTCSTRPASPRRKRIEASLRPTAAASISRSRCRFSISAGRMCARPSSAISRRSTRSREKAVNARSEAREAYGAYRRPTPSPRSMSARCCRCRDTISAETELQYNAMQVDAFALLEAARAKAQAKVASIEAKRNFWLASTDLSVAVLGGGGLSRRRRNRRCRRRERTAGH